MFLAKVSIKRPVLITMLISVFLVFGVLAYLGLSLNLMPAIDFPFVVVQTVYVGAGPQEIESQISRRIEDAVSIISQVDFIQTYSMENVSFVMMRFSMRKSQEVAIREVKEKIDAILNELPRDAERPIALTWDISAIPVMDIVFSGEVSGTELYDYADQRLRDRFSQIEGIARVEISGGQKREIHVVLNRQTVEQNAISLPQLSGILAAYNMDMPGGQFQQRGQEFAVRLQGQIGDLETLRNLEIPTISGLRKLHEIAEIIDTGSEIRERAIFFDNRTGVREDNIIRFSLIPSPEGNPVNISRQVHREWPDILAELPENMKLYIVTDRADFIESSVNDTMGNILLGILFTGILLFLFLNDLRSTFIVALAMPTSIISTFILMQIAGFTLNMMTLMGFSTAVGILVTNSVIVLENIFRHKNMGNTRKVAADLGTSEIATAVIASTLTNIVVFLPIATMTSMAGQFFTEFALVVTFATLFSLLISFTLTPMLASQILPQNQKDNRFSKKMEKIFMKWEAFYKKILGFLIKNRKIAISFVGSVFILLVLSFFIAAAVGFEFLPSLDEGNIRVEVELPEGYDLSETALVMEQVKDIISQHSEVDFILTNIGSIGTLNVGSNVARASVNLIAAKERNLTTRQIADIFIEDLSGIPNTKIRVSAISSIGGGDSPINFFVMGQDLDRLEEMSQEIYDKLKDIPGLANLNTSLRPGKPELTFKPRLDRMSAAGVTSQELAINLRSSVEGLVATQYREGDREYDVKVLLDRPSYDTPAKIADLPIVTQSGVYSFSQLADLDFATGSSMLFRKDKFAAIEFTGDLTGGAVLGDITGQINQVITNEVELPPGFRVEWGGESQMLDETITDMIRTFILAVLLTYMLLAAILESFVQPIFILATLPLALIGVFLALFVTGQTMNIVSMMAIIMLVGIVVNNAILLLDYTNQLVRRGDEVRTALLIACPTKLKPIVMATFAIILGMLPMALGIGTAAREFRQAMGIVSIGGVIVSALLTLFIIPSVYYLFIRTKQVE
ncbi:MAG: efflux RND transporter permease subunit [Candidatus Cloacimonetes bacterium]|nr:efflux RND transporter permease subunit [Candidatus Cloacimonadota bacterium]